MYGFIIGTVFVPKKTMNDRVDRFQQKYRIPSARASCWNYANAGLYFITICTVRREQLFGKIKNRKMYLSPIGEIVQQEWDRSFEIRTELFHDAFVIMPNHIHAILRIENGLTARRRTAVRLTGPCVSTIIHTTTIQNYKLWRCVSSAQIHIIIRCRF